MAGLDNNMLSVIECLAKNKIQDAKMIQQKRTQRILITIKNF